MEISVGADGLKRGPYGEVFPPPLVAGIDPQQALQYYAQRTQADGNPVQIPARGMSRDGMELLATAALHHDNLRAALMGQYVHPDMRDLLVAVMRGERLSMRPLFMETLYFSSFAPVLQRLGTNRWRLGIEAEGRYADLRGPTGTVIDQAAALYAAWSAADTQAFRDRAAGFLKNATPNLAHHSWSVCMRRKEAVEVAECVTVLNLNHNLYALDTPRGLRLYTTARPTGAAEIATQIAQQLNLDVKYPDLQEIANTLCGCFEATPQQEGNVWVFPHGRAKWEESQAAIVHLEHRFKVQTQLGRWVLRQATDNKEIAALVDHAGLTVHSPLGKDLQRGILAWAMMTLDRLHTSLRKAA